MFFMTVVREYAFKIRKFDGRFFGHYFNNVVYFHPEILSDKTMEDILMCIPNDYIQNYPFCRSHERLETQLIEPINKYSITVTKVDEQTVKKILLKI